jgi:hypothetical protein
MSFPRRSRRGLGCKPFASICGSLALALFIHAIDRAWLNHDASDGRPSEDIVFKKLLIAVVVLGGLGLAGFAVWRPAIAPVALPAPGSFASELIAQGEALAGGGYCAACHTAKDGERFAGGCAMATPFGVIYSTNICPIRSLFPVVLLRSFHQAFRRGRAGALCLLPTS